MDLLLFNLNYAVNFFKVLIDEVFKIKAGLSKFISDSDNRFDRKLLGIIN